MANFNSNELFQEVFDRGLINDVKGKVIKKTLMPTLKSHLAGLSRPPTMSFGDVNKTLAKLNLESYEVCFVLQIHFTTNFCVVGGFVQNHKKTSLQILYEMSRNQIPTKQVIFL